MHLLLSKVYYIQHQSDPAESERRPQTATQIFYEVNNSIDVGKTLNTNSRLGQSFRVVRITFRKVTSEK